MNTFFEFMAAALLLIAIFGSIYVKWLSVQIDEHERGYRKLAADLEKLKARQNVYEKRLMRAEDPDKIYIERRFTPDKDAPKFGGF